MIVGRLTSSIAFIAITVFPAPVGSTMTPRLPALSHESSALFLVGSHGYGPASEIWTRRELLDIVLDFREFALEKLHYLVVVEGLSPEFSDSIVPS